MTDEDKAFAAALKNMPDRRPRPEGELAELERVWEPPKGWRLISAVNNNYIGVFYVGAALLFFLLGGILALLMRLQLAQPMGDIIGQDTFNQLFTMHGTVMMFLFAVPAVEAMGVLLLPQMYAARDLPFPRLSAYAFWAYLIGGLVFFTTIFYGAAPDGGWFMYPPNSSYIYSPGDNSDWWLLGIGFIEISAIAGAIEIIVGTLKTRAPGMTLDKLPLFGWAMLVMAGMIVIGFPAIILSTILLELERAFHWPFFMAEKGGDPLLWQHLFWFFGHPEVYIIFLPAAGMISMIVPTIARAKMVGHRLVVLALVATGFISFGVWVHHMLTTGLPDISISFFSAASMAVSVPAGIQVFAWIATLMVARKIRFTVPALFTLGFLVIFVMGGLTGVMLAMVPFDWQAHDTYFVVAHLHYVLIGGMVFPLFAAIYYWTPMSSDRPLSERLGKIAFWLMFTGMHVAFLPMHWTGLMGMPRRVYTYLPDTGLDTVNMVSTIGAFTFAAGVAVFLVDMAKNFRFGQGAGNIHGGGTLEWLPAGNYSVRSIPVPRSNQPLWDDPDICDDVEKGHWFLPGPVTGRRETIVTSPITAAPQYLMIIPGPGWWPVIAAAGTAGFFLLLTVKAILLASLFGVIAIVGVYRWVWELDPGPDHPPVDVGGGLKLPVYATGAKSHAIWASWVLIVVLGMIFASLVFGYFFMWSGRPDAWPPAGIGRPGAIAVALPLLFYGASAVAIRIAGRLLPAPGERRRAFLLALGGALALLVGGLFAEIAMRSALDPTASSYGAVSYAFTVLNGQLVAMLTLFAGLIVARVLARKSDRARRISFDCMALLWSYAAAQAAVSLLLVGLFPLAGG